MKKINVAEATNTQLDWLVARIEGRVSDDIDDFRLSVPGEFSYTTVRDLIGPIAEREEFLGAEGFTSDGVRRCIVYRLEPLAWAHGPDSLIAAARCYVVSKLGKEAEVPEEL